MKLKMVSMSLAIITAAFATTVPYLIGRFIGVYALLQNKALIINLFTSTKHKTAHELLPSAIEEHPTTRSTMRYAETNETNQNAAVSGTCQSLGLDIDKIDEQLLQSTISMENILSTLISNETFSESHIIRAPRCEPLQAPHGPAMNHRRLHCDALLSNTYLHIYTWPLSGATSIDIFSCNAKVTLMSLIPTIRDLFVVNKASSLKLHEEPMIRWHYKFRGDRSDDGHSAYMNGDMGSITCAATLILILRKRSYPSKPNIKLLIYMILSIQDSKLGNNTMHHCERMIVRTIRLTQNCSDQIESYI